MEATSRNVSDLGAIFEILGKPAAAAQPGKGSLDDPALGQNGKISFESRFMLPATR